MGFIIEPISYDDYIRHRFYGYFLKRHGNVTFGSKTKPILFCEVHKANGELQGGARPMQLLLSP